MNISKLVDDLENGLGYGMDIGYKVVTLDPKKVEKPTEVTHQKAFEIAKYIGEISGGTFSIILFDIGSLGILPLFNYYKYHRKKI